MSYISITNHTHSFHLNNEPSVKKGQSCNQFRIKHKMEKQEAEDEEWNNNNFTLGKKILVAGFIASSAPIVVPPLVVASAIGLAVSMPYAFLYATHACTQNLMSKLLPTTPTTHINNDTIYDDDIVKHKEQQGNDTEYFKTPFEVTTVAFEECDDKEIGQEELQRETKGLLEKIRDEGRGGEEYKVDNVNTNDSQNSLNEAEASQSQVLKIRDEDEYRVDNINDSKNHMAEAEASEFLDGKSFLHETSKAESDGDLLRMEECNVLAAEDLLDGSIIIEEGKFDNDVPDFANQESQLHEYNEIMDSSDADARGIADESKFDEKIVDLEVYSYSIDLHEESSNNVMIDRHTDHMEVLVSTAENKFKPSECSSGEDIMCSSHQIVFNDEESIWKQIQVIRKIIGCEGATQATCVDELKALYIFTGVEPPTFLKENSCDPAEINEKLHLLMSIVGIKSSMA
ncbi:hypothetical protein RIF29_21791 [Crotalaria pallida]|uniref:Uncharacterized protein n=1 Tax=Crotalaria pallida TaxID=3830 RepID=A0AAN9F5Y7_CROPI